MAAAAAAAAAVAQEANPKVSGAPGPKASAGYAASAKQTHLESKLATLEEATMDAAELRAQLAKDLTEDLESLDR